MQEPGDNRASIIGVITSPLGFFALSLLIVEGFLGIVLSISDLGSGQKFWGMIIGAVLFVFVVLLVFILVWKKPTNLTFGEHSHLIARFGTSDNPEPRSKIVEDVPTIPPVEHLNKNEN